ncbi:ClpXP protease specificity-enhancing factor SspB [Candidatus Puniceispirillum sp.]|nr:ClpXP protease specificity-enhancing factor SspB [Candidatus Puniceispirillum sp.]
MTDSEMLQTGLNYELLVEDALRSVVRTALGIVEKVGLPGETHFYISFSTLYSGVEIDDHLRSKHPENMTIVLQHQFADLKVNDDEFSVTLFFSGKPSPMIIPFQAITSFNDPSVGFGLQFGMADEDEDDNEQTVAGKDDNVAGLKNGNHKANQSNENSNGNSADVVSLDKFRKKPTK